MKTESSNWIIETLNPAPSMNTTTRGFTGTYAGACCEARQQFASTGQRTSVLSGSSTTHWFRVSRDGEANYNTNAATR